MYLKILCLLFIGMIVGIVQADELANKKFRAALNVCEKALQVEMPKSYGSLSRLNGLLKRYQRNRDEALAVDPSLKDSTEQHYKGDFFADKPFVEAYRICEGELPSKVSQAESQVQQKESARKARQQALSEQSNALLEKIDLAKNYVASAINRHCANYLRAPTSASDAVSPLYQEYQQAKQQAIATYPEIVRQFHQVLITDPENGEEKTVSKTVGLWFKYCDAQFTHQPEKEEEPPAKENPSTAVEAEGPMLPPASPPVVEKTADAPEPSPENQEDEIDPDYQAALKYFKGDRLKVLTDEKRVPDFVDNEDNDLKKSNVWQYEDEEKCTTYTFQSNKLTKSKTTPGECDSF